MAKTIFYEPLGCGKNKSWWEKDMLIRPQYLENIILTKLFLLSTCPTTSVMSKLTIPNDRAKSQYTIVHKVSVIFFEDDTKLDP